MVINYANKHQIDKIYLHDSVFKGFHYNYYDRQILLTCTNSYLNKIFDFKFNDVIYFKMQSCLFWTYGYNIYDIYITEFPEEFIKQINEIKNTKPDFYENSQVGTGTEYIAIEIMINSGDTLLIICESVDFTETEFEDN